MLLWSENVRIETPEQIDFEVEVAGPGSRLLAQLVDWIIKWVIVCFLLMIGGAVISVLEGVTYDRWSRATANLFVAILLLVICLFFLGYDVYFEGLRNGQTPGKRMCGIRVVREGGAPIDTTAAFIRNLVGLADFLPFCYLVGGVVMIFNSRAQRLGDMAAGTLVMRERRDEAPDNVARHIRRLASDDYVFRQDCLDRCDPNDTNVLHSFFARYFGMERRERRRLRERLCDIFLHKVRYLRSDWMNSPRTARSFLASLYRNLKAHRRYR